MLISFSNTLYLDEFALKWSLIYFQPIFSALFVTIAKVKVKLLQDFYTQGIVLIN